MILKKNKTQKIIFGIAIIAVMLFSLTFISAHDTTPPVTGIYMSQEATAGVHNDISYKFSVTAHLFNNESVSYSINSCQIDWGEGTGWQSVSKGAKGVWYMVNHLYSTSGLKTIKYKCQNDAGLWSSGNAQHLNWDSITIDIQAPTTQIFLSQDSADGSHNDFSYSKTIFAHLLNNHSLYSVDECKIDWGEGNGLELIGTGAKGIIYTLSHTYSTLGVKKVSYACRNLQGAWSSGDDLHVNQDSIEILNIVPVFPPVIAVSSPEQGKSYIDSVILTATCNQAVNWKYNLNDGANVSIASNSRNIAYNLSGVLIKGDNTLIVYGTNANGTSAKTISFSFEKSVVPPTPQNDTILVWFSAPTPASGIILRNNTFRVNASASSENFANLTHRFFDSDHNLIFNPTSLNNNFYWGFGAADGFYYFDAVACDIFGKCVSTELRNITLNTSFIDNDYPVVTVVSPAQNAVYTSNAITINFYATDASGIKEMWYYDGTVNRAYNSPETINLVDGSYTFVFYAKDNFDNINSASVSFSVDTSSNNNNQDNEDDDDDSGSGDYDSSLVFVTEDKPKIFQTETEANSSASGIINLADILPEYSSGASRWIISLLTLGILIIILAIIAYYILKR